VIAFAHGGAAAVGLVGFARMFPAALVAPAAATIADRVRRESVLAWVGVVRALTLGGAAVVSGTGGPIVLVYVALVLATIAQTLFRPAHSALLPSLCTTPNELTSANVARGLLDSTATLLGPLIAALLLKLSGAAAVLAAAATASALAAMLVITVRYDAPPRLASFAASSPFGQAIAGIRVIGANRAVRLLTALDALQTFTRGALTVFAVVLAIKVLGTGAAGVGVLTAALGGGAVVGSLAATLLVGRGVLARWFGIGVGLWGAPLAVIGGVAHLWPALIMLAIVGVGNAVVDVGVFTLIARLVDDDVLARVFAAFEGIITLAVALGAIVTPVVIDGLGTRAALVIIGALGPAAVFVCWRSLRALDHRMRVRDVDVALLQRIPMLRPLPQATIEQLAARLTRIELPAGATVFEQGDQGDDFYVIERGQVDLIRDGKPIAALQPGAGFGEIALIRDSPRMASVRTTTSTTLGALSRQVFVAAVTGYPQSKQAVDRVITGHLAG
jgi:Na+/melibiose symporter-like transporter